MSDTTRCGIFCRYFSYDLRRAWYNCGLSAVCVGALPLIFYLFSLLFHVLGLNASPTDSSATAALIPVAYILYVLVFPAKLYGEITVRRAGGNFLMLPASIGVKFASMLLILLLVVPLVIAIIFSACDLLLSIIPSYGPNLMARASDDLSGLLGSGFSMRLLASTTIEQFFNCVLFFTLGAIIFKRKKTGKTILSYIALVMILVIIVLLIANAVSANAEFETDLKYYLSDYLKEWHFELFCNTVNISFGLLLGFFVHRRIKKIEL